MIQRRQQRGMTLIGWLIVIGLIAYFTLLIITVFPMYLNHFKVTRHLRDLGAESAKGGMDKAALIASLNKRFQIDDVQYVDVAKDLKVESDPKTGKTTIRLPYEVRAHFLSNVYIVGDFKETKVEVKGN